jgi:hypothetical protein
MRHWTAKEHHAIRRILRVAGVTALGIAVTFALPRATHAQTVIAPPVPANLQVPTSSQAFLLGHGVGTQNYVCAPSDSIGHVAFTLFTPQATLFNDLGDQLTTHFFSPNPVENVVRVTWEDSQDTSTVWGQVTASSVDPAFVRQGAIPWLLVQAVGAQAGPTGGRTLSATTFIQRVNTVGGVAPSTGCSLPTNIGTKAFVPYTADYIFYRN